METLRCHVARGRGHFTAVTLRRDPPIEPACALGTLAIRQFKERRQSVDLCRSRYNEVPRYPVEIVRSQQLLSRSPKLRILQHPTRSGSPPHLSTGTNRLTTRRLSTSSFRSTQCRVSEGSSGSEVKSSLTNKDTVSPEVSEVNGYPPREARPLGNSQDLHRSTPLPARSSRVEPTQTDSYQADSENELLPAVGAVGVQVSDGPAAANSNAPLSLTGWVPLLMESAAEAVSKVVASRTGGLVVLNVITMLYATNTTIVKGAAEAAGGPLPFCLGRFAIAALVLSPLLPSAFSNPIVRRCGIEMGLWTALAYLTQAFALLTTGAGRVSFISTFTMIEVPLVAGLLGARISPLVWAATASAVSGVLLLEANSEASTLAGDALALVSAMAFGLQIIRSAEFAKRVPPTASLDLISMQIFTVACCSAVGLALTALLDLPSASIPLSDSTTTAAAVAAVVTAPAAIAASTAEPASLTVTTVHNSGIGSLLDQGKELVSLLPSSDELARFASWAGSWPWLQMAYTGVVSTALCLWLEILAFRHVAASDAAVIYTLDPLYSAVLASIVLQEEWTTLSYFGAALIFGGSVVVQLGDESISESEKQ